MKVQNIEKVIAKKAKIPKNLLPVDVLLIEGKLFPEKIMTSTDKTSTPIDISSINYIGTIRRTPYSPISTIFKLDF